MAWDFETDAEFAEQLAWMRELIDTQIIPLEPIYDQLPRDEWRVVEAQLASRRFIEGDQFTIVDIALGAYARRWFGVEGVTKPKQPNMERWFAQISERPAFVKHIAPPMS